MKTLLAAILALLFTSATQAQLAITEINSSGANLSNGVPVVQNSDFWELSNFGATAIDLTGYRWNDNAGGLIAADPTPFTGVIIGPGESIIFFESNVAMNVSAAQVRNWWGLPESVQVIPYMANGLSSAGDSVLLWGPSAANDADLVDGVVFSTALRGSTFTYNPLTGAYDRFSTNGVGGALKAFTTDDIGSPGTNTGPVALGILQQPQNTSVNPGDIATFTVGWRGLPRPKFQWRREGTDIPGARFATLTVPNVQLDKLGHYSVLLDNGVDMLASSNATLALNAQPEPPHFIVSP